MNSLPSSSSIAAAGSSAASAETEKLPPVLPACALTSLNASSVLAAPQEEIRKLRRSRLVRRAFLVDCSSASRLAASFAFDSGIGSNSPFDVVSILIGSLRPSGSLRFAMLPPVGSDCWHATLSIEYRSAGRCRAVSDRVYPLLSRPKPPPPGVSITNRSPASSSISSFPRNGTSVPSARST